MRSQTIPWLAIGLGLVTALAGCEAVDSLTPESDGIAAEELSALLSSATEDGPVIVADSDAADADRRRAGETDEGQRTRQRPGKSVFQQLAEQIPSFGGLYRTAPCSVALVLTDLSEAERAIEIVKAVVEPLVERGCPDGIRVEAVGGKYTYLQLLRVRHALRPLHRIEGVVGARIDFQQNKVIVGVTTREVLEQVRRALARIGVPPDAVGVELVNRPDRR